MAYNDASQPLLEKQGYTVIYVDDEETAAAAEAAQFNAQLKAAEEKHRRQRRRRIGHFVLITILIAFLGASHLVRHVHKFTITAADTALDGPLQLTGHQCLIHGDAIEAPTLTFPVVFGDVDAHPGLTVYQNTTPHDHHHPPDDAHSGTWTHVEIDGDVVYRKAGPGQEPSVVVESVFNDDRILRNVAYNPDNQTLHVIVDDLIWVEHGVDDKPKGRACAVIRITVWVPEVEAPASPAGTVAPVHLKSLHTGVVHLGIKLIEDLDLVVSDNIFLGSVAGAVRADIPLTGDGKTKTGGCALSPLNLRKHHAEVQREEDGDADLTIASAYRLDAPVINVYTVSGAIAGPWSLFDFLGLASVSGSVHAKVLPQDDYITGKEPTADVAAGLRIQTTSGSVVLYEADTDAKRGHGVTVGSQSGKVQGSVKFSDWATFHTVSGKIDVDLLAVRPVPTDGNGLNTVGRLTTKTTSGSATVSLSSLDDPLDWLVSDHSSVSGSIALNYPAEWAGHAELKTLASGRVSVAGKDVHVIPDKRPAWPPLVGKKIEAVKGELPASNLTAFSTSSRISLVFPE